MNNIHYMHSSSNKSSCFNKEDSNKFLHTKLKAHINIQKKDRASLISHMVTPQFSNKYLLQQAKRNYLPEKRVAFNAHRLPAIRKSYISTQGEEAEKENINPNEYFNNLSNDYCNVSLNKKLRRGISQNKRRPYGLPNGRNQSIDSKRTNMILPDDSNYNNIVNFVKDIKNSIATLHEYPNSEEQSNKKQNMLDNRTGNLSNISVVNPLHLNKSSRFSLTGTSDEKKEQLTLFPVMKLGFDIKKLKLAIHGPICII